MTAREISAFDEMFNMIFDAVSEKTLRPDVQASASDIGVGRGGINDLFGKLRKHSKRMKWTTESDEEMDRKKEAMDMCNTDQELLEWAMREVFDESQRYESACRAAIDEAVKSGTPKELPMLQSPTYPHLVALLMKAFRDKYNDPHLALSIFNHARHLSIASYVFGCSTKAYNELIETRWTCFRDLKGVHDALEEMHINGVHVDSQTRKLVESLRREVGERNLWIEESEIGSGEVWTMLSKIEQLVSKQVQRSPKTTGALEPQPMKWDDWKAQPMDDSDDDQWGFDQWEKPDQNRRDGPRHGDNGTLGERWQTSGLWNTLQ